VKFCNEAVVQEKRVKWLCKDKEEYTGLCDSKTWSRTLQVATSHSWKVHCTESSPSFTSRKWRKYWAAAVSLSLGFTFGCSHIAKPGH